MSKISLYSALSGASALYVKHIILLATLGAISGVVSWSSLVGPRHLARSLGVYQEMPEETIEITADGSNVTGIINRTSTKIAHYMDTTSKGSLFLIFLTMVVLWLAAMFVHLGLIKVALQLVDKNKSSFDTFLSVKQYLPTYIGSSLLFGLYSLVVATGSSIVMVPIFIIIAKVAHLSAWTALIAMPLVVAGAFAYLIRYVLFSYCIIDKNAGVFGALSMSATITQGQRMHLFGFFCVMGVFFYVLFGLIRAAFDIHITTVHMHSILYMVAIYTIVTPLTILMISKVYRQLTSK